MRSKHDLPPTAHYFEKLIQTHLLDNVHRTTLRLKPDPELGRRFEEEEKARLAAIREVDERRVKLQELRRKHQSNSSYCRRLPTRPKHWQPLPVLQLSDLEKENKTIPIEVIQIQDTPVLYHDLFTNGIVYLDLGFDLHALANRIIATDRDLRPRPARDGNRQGRLRQTLAADRKKHRRNPRQRGQHHSLAGRRENVSKLFMRGKATMGQVH